MPGLLFVASKNLAYRRTRSLITLLAVALGTAVAAATFSTNLAIDERLRASARAMVGDADLVIESLEPGGLPQHVLQTVQSLPDVQLAAPQVQKRTFFRAGERRGFAEIVGVDPVLDPRIHPLSMAAGRFFESADERSVLLVRDWADREGLRVGSSLELMTQDGFRPFTVVGLVAEADLSQKNFGGLIRVPLQVAQSSLGLQERVATIGVKLRDPSRADAVKASLDSAIPYLFLIRETPRVLDDLLVSMWDFQVALVFFGIIALVAGAFLVFNTLSLSVAEQVREIGLLRAAGMTSRDVVRLTLIQGLLLGVVGAVVGVLAGQILAATLVGIVGLTQGIPTSRVPLSPSGILGSLTLGVAITLAASVNPAIQAGRITPLMALRWTGLRETAEERGVVLPLALALTGVIILFLAIPIEGPLIAWGPVILGPSMPPNFGPSTRLIRGLSLLALFPLFTYASRAFIPLAIALAGPVISLWMRGSPAVSALAQRNLDRERARTSVTVAGFVISLSLVVALFDSTESFSAAGGQLARSLFPGHFVVVSPVPQPSVLVREFAGLPGVEQASMIATTPIVSDGLALTAIGVEPDHYFQAFELTRGERTEAFRQLQRGGAVLVPERLAQHRGVQPGRAMHIKVGEREATFVVAGVIAHSLPSSDNFGALVLSTRDMQERLGVSAFRFIAVSAHPSADLRILEAELARTAELFGMESRFLASLEDSISRGVSGLFGLLIGLVFVGVVVGVLNVVTTMLMAITQRQREIGILRAEGMTRGAVQRLFMAEAALMGLAGALLGAFLGIVLTRAIVDLNRGPNFEPAVYVSLPVIGGVLAFAVLSAALAAFYPAGVAARTSIVDAVSRQ